MKFRRAHTNKRVDLERSVVYGGLGLLRSGVAGADASFYDSLPE